MSSPSSLEQTHRRGAPRPLLAWKLNVADPLVASVRYRALMPARGLQELGYDSVVLAGREGVADFAALHALIFVKTFHEHDVALARAAHKAGVPVYFDLCDNIFVEDYAGESDHRHAARFKDIAALCAGVITTGPELARIIAANVPNGPPIHVAPDQVETAALTHDLVHARAWREDGRGARANTEASPPEAKRKRRSARWRASWRWRPSLRPRKTVIWFGNSGAAHGRFGLPALADIMDDLAAADRETPLRLLVVTNDHKKFIRLMPKAPFPVAFRPWTPLGVFEDIAGADLCVVPNSKDEFSAPKSANRIVLALSLGVPVVASAIAAAAPLSGALIFDDWRGGVGLYLRDRNRARADVARGQAIIEAEYSARRVAEIWRAILPSAGAPPTP